METIKIDNLENIDNAAQKFVELLNTKYFNRKCIAFNGQMGVGKTTFITAICKAMGVNDKVSSPTFSIVNEYKTPNNQSIYHFDLYRIKDTEEAMAAGAEEYIYSDNYCFIEWPETLIPILPNDTINVNITEDSNGLRILTIE